MSDAQTPRTDAFTVKTVDELESKKGPRVYRMADFARQLERELAEAKASEVNHRNTSQSLIEECERLHAECVKIDKQLTAHKAALNLCQMALNSDTHDTFIELKAEALSEIDKLKGYQ